MVGKGVQDFVVGLELEDAGLGGVEVVVGGGGESGDDEDSGHEEEEAHLLMIYDKKDVSLVCFSSIKVS